MKIKNRQFAAVIKQIFKTIYAFDIDIYRPYKDAEGYHVLEDEIEFEEADEVGRLKEEDLPISYTVLDTAKAVRCKINEDSGKVSHVRAGDANEFEPDKQFMIMINSDNIPTKTVIQFEVPTALAAEDDSVQTVSLIKVTSAPLTQQPYAGITHIFVPFHGVV